MFANAAWVAICMVAKVVAFAFAASLWVVKAAVTILGGAFTVLRAIMVTLFAVMSANPIVLIVAGIIALVGAVIYYWDEIKAVLADLGVFDAIDKAIAMISAGWADFMAFMSNLSPFQLLGKAVDWLIDKLNMIPGVNIELGSMPDLTMPAMPGAMNLQAPERQQEVINAPLARYRQQEQSAVPSGGLGKQLIQANAAATTANQKPAKAMHIGEVHNHFANPITPGEMEQEVWITTK